MIERLYVNNFRCLDNFVLDLSGQGSLLIIGNNGTGKSAIRHALGVLQKIGRGPNRVKDWIDSTDFAQGRTHLPIRLEVEVTLSERRFRYAISFEMPEKHREARVAEERLWVDDLTIFSRQQSQVALPGDVAFGLDSNVAALPVIEERGSERLIHQLKTFLASIILLAPIPETMRGFSEEESPYLHTDGGNFSSWLNHLLIRHPRTYGVMTDYLRAVMGDFASFENVPRGEKGKQLVVTFADEDPGRALSLGFPQLSDGEKCLFLSAVIVASNKVGDPVFCMWDEPDHHLSLAEIGYLIAQLRKLVHHGGQFIATSHHPETIRRFSDNTTLVLTRRSHLEPTMGRLLAELSYSGDLIEALVRDEAFG